MVNALFAIFRLYISTKGVDASAEEVTYYDLIITKEHKLLGNTFKQEELERSENPKTLVSYYEAF